MKIKKFIMKNLGSFSVFVAMMTVTVANSHCLLILNQPDIPKELKELIKRTE